MTGHLPRIDVFQVTLPNLETTGHIRRMTSSTPQHSDRLAYDVLTLDPLPMAPEGKLPNGDARQFQPMAMALISGATDAVLVDTPVSEAQAKVVGDWIAATGKNLTHIAITHGHGDHWFAADLLARRFGAEVVATSGTIEEMRANVGVRSLLWDVVFPGQIPASPVTATTAPDDRFTLEGHDIVLVPVGASDTVDTSVVHVPDLDLVVAGDVLYSGAHMYLGQAAAAGVQDWREAIGKVAALHPRYIVASHSDPFLDRNADRIIASSLKYLDDSESVLADSTTALDFFDSMLKRYPEYRYGTTIAWVSAKAIRAVRDGRDDQSVAVEAWLGA
jgi:glyoxylase-like metal-dependent hydrolase (beta-lactamase superfamily II)